jgi:hypothetical protein
MLIGADPQVSASEIAQRSYEDAKEIKNVLHAPKSLPPSIMQSSDEIGLDDFRISFAGPDGVEAYDTWEPAVAYNSVNNEYLIVWEGEDELPELVDNEYEIFAQRVDGATGQLLGGNFRISDMGPDGSASWDAQQPAVSYNSIANEYLVVWEGEDGLAEFEVYGQRLNAMTGAEVGQNDFRISDMGPVGDSNFRVDHVAVAFNSHQNEYLIVWRGDDATDEEYEVFGQRLDRFGNEIGSNDFRISFMGQQDGNTSYAAWDPDVAYNPVSREYMVCWSGDDSSEPLVDNEFEIFCQRLAAPSGIMISGPSWVSDMGPYGSALYEAQNPRVAVNAQSGEYLIVWHGSDDNTPLIAGETEIFGQLLNQSGALVGPHNFRISDMGPNSNVIYDALFPRVVYSSSRSEFGVAWIGDDSSGQLVDDEMEIYFQRVSTSGSELGLNDLRISSVGMDGSTLYNPNNLALAYNSVAGNYLATWYGDDNVPQLANDEYEVFGQLLAPLRHVHLPIVLRNYIPIFYGPFEVEDNDSYLEANRFLISGQNYHGYPDDQKDYFGIYLFSSGTINVTLTGHTGRGVQFQLFYQSAIPENRKVNDREPPYVINYSGEPGPYYIYIFTESGFNSSASYTLSATFPAE